MLVLTAAPFMAPSVKSLLSAVPKEFQREGAAVLEQRMSLEITISVLQKRLVAGICKGNKECFLFKGIKSK